MSSARRASYQPDLGEARSEEVACDFPGPTSSPSERAQRAGWEDGPHVKEEEFAGR